MKQEFLLEYYFIKKGTVTNTVFRELLRDFDKYASASSAEDTEQIALEILAELDSYLKGQEKMAEDTEEIDNNHLSSGAAAGAIAHLNGREKTAAPVIVPPNAEDLTNPLVEEIINRETGGDSYTGGLGEGAVGGVMGGLAGLGAGVAGLRGVQKLRQYLKNKKTIKNPPE